MILNWENYRRENGTIDLREALIEITAKMYVINTSQIEIAKGILENIELLQPIKSRQCAATAITNAITHVFGRME